MLMDAQTEAVAHRENTHLIGHLEGASRANLELPLAGHDLRIDAGDLQAALDACVEVRLRERPPIHALRAYRHLLCCDRILARLTIAALCAGVQHGGNAPDSMVVACTECSWKHTHARCGLCCKQAETGHTQQKRMKLHRHEKKRGGRTNTTVEGALWGGVVRAGGGPAVRVVPLHHRVLLLKAIQRLLRLHLHAPSHA